MSRFLPFALAVALFACDSQPAATPAHAAPPAADRTSSSAPPQGASETVAKIGDQAITLAEVDKAGAAGVIKARNDLYAARKQALDQMIGEQLVEAEAKARGIDEEALMKAEIDDKVEPVSDAEIEKFFAENQNRMRGSYEQMKEQIRGYLDSQSKGKRMLEFVEELKAKANVVVLLEPVRVEVDPGDSPRYGKADAPVEIIEFSDFQCPYCTRGANTLDEVKEKYGDKVTVVYRHFPLDFHDRANIAAQASECANDQGKFWEYHDKLFQNQQAMADTDLETYAQQVELNVAQFKECLRSGKHIETVATDLEEGAEAGMSGTPGFFINGRFLGGALPLEAFSEVIDAELAKQG